MFVGISIGYNTDRVLYIEIGIEILSFTEISGIADDIAVVFKFNNIILPYSRTNFYGFAVITHTTKESHGNYLRLLEHQCRTDLRQTTGDTGFVQVLVLVVIDVEVVEEVDFAALVGANRVIL